MFRLLALILLALPVPALAAEPPPSPAARAAWGFDRTDLPPHPDVRFGVLANGLRYAVMRSAQPAGGLSVRMRVDVGATAEGAREQGYVHLIEHLIFHGSENYPPGSLLFSLPRDGLRRFSDFNAVTDYGQTLFRLDLARSDAQARETALTLMDEIARHLAFGRATLRRAKTEVIEEIESRDGAQDRVMTAQNAFLLPGTPLARGPVAGTARSVRRAGGKALRRLYDLYYRPERTILVMVGDLEPAETEAQIRARFSDWRARAPDAAPAPARRFPERGDETRLFVDAEAPTLVTIARVAPIGEGDSAGARDTRFLEQLGSAILQKRLAAAAARPGAAFADPLAAAYDYFGTAEVASIDLAAPGRDWRGVLAAGQAALEQALAEGFRQAELDAALDETRRRLDEAAAPRTSASLADAIVDAANRGIVFTRPAGAAASAGWLEQVTLADLNAAFRRLWSGPGRLIFIAHNHPIESGARAAAEAMAGGGGSRLPLVRAARCTLPYHDSVS